MKLHTITLSAEGQESPEGISFRNQIGHGGW